MTTEIIIAPPVTGKTTACIERIRNFQANGPLRRIWVIVPDRLQAAAFRRRLAITGGVLGTYVGTFGDLYRRILEHSGIYIPIASSPLLYRLIQETVDRAVAEGDLAHFAPLQSQPGFILALRESFAELKRFLVYPEHFIDISRSGSTAQKELAILYSRYQARLHQLNLADPEGISWLAVEELEHQSQLADPIDLLIVDGFDSFNGVQYNALKMLSPKVGDLLITFPGKIGSQRSAHRRFAENIEKLIRELSPRVSTINHSPYLTPSLLHIESQLFETKIGTEEKSDQPILLEVHSPADEVREVLRWIKSLIVRNKISLSSCMIFTPNPKVYNPLLRVYATEYGIPIHFTQDEPLSNSPAITAIVNLISLPSRNYRTRYLINLLRSPYFELSMSPEIVDQFEMVSRVAQIVEGRDQWSETWERLSPSSIQDQTDLDDERILPGLPRGSQASELRLAMDAFFDNITPPDRVCTQTEWITWLEDLLDRLRFYERANSERDQAACETFRETLRALVLSEEIAGERRGDYRQFLNDLQGTLEGIGIQEPDSSGEPALLVGRMVDARGLRFQAVALLGFSEGEFPVNEHPDPFLDENLRDSLGLEQRLKREQAGLFYQAVTRTDHYLLITRPYLSDDGEKWEASTFWKSIQQLFDTSVVNTIRPDDPRPLIEAASSQELLFSAIRRQSLPQEYEFLNPRWIDLHHARAVLRARRSKHAGGPHEGFVAPIAPALRQRYSSDQIWSASRLEYYGSCPYQFFVRTALGLESRILPKLGLDPNQLGSMLHKILEETYKNLSDPKDIEAVLESLKIASGQVFSTAPRVYGFRPSSLWDYEKAQLLEKLEKTVRALGEDSDWTPFAYELVFGINGISPLEVDLGEETIRIRGVIDRVDRDPNGHLRVVDYKTGSSHLTSGDLKNGYRLQLPIYALAVRDALNLGTPVDGVYWKILGAEAGSLKLAKFKTDSAQGLDAASGVVRENLLRIVKGVHSAEFPPHPPRAGCPSYCPTSQWCWRFDPEW